jgi:hypothetical protein
MRVIMSITTLMLAGGIVSAQQHIQTEVLKAALPGMGSTVPHIMALAARSANAQMDVQYIAAEFGGKVVKGAPYSAEEVTETRQTLADGNHITRRSSALVYRDGQGRTRREQSLEAIGPLGLQSQEPLKTITINDPASGMNYILDAATKTARKLPAADVMMHAPSADQVPAGQVFERHVAISGPPGSADMPHTAGVRVLIRHTESGDANKEALGKQVIEGIEAEGSRVTVTTPAGQLGNELPIQTISESWYSPKLQTVVLSMQSDPRMGETTFRLTKVELGEPAPSLFEVPADYKVVSDGNMQFIIHKEGPAVTK